MTVVSEQRAVNVGPAGIEVAYERLGDPQAPPVLLVMGLALQMYGWPDGFCAELTGRGMQVIRFDNRDCGLSSHFHDAPVPDLAAARRGDLSSASYDLSDMAADTVGLLDALGLASAHVVGLSLGGAIGQTMAIGHPDRVRSLTSLMSTTGAPGVGRPDPGVLGVLAGPPAANREEAVERTVRAVRVMGSPGFPFDEAAVRERAARAFDRDYDPLGVARQALASLASGDRTALLAGVRVPTLVIHGADDPVCDVSGGRATAAAVPDAELAVFEGMGHDLPRELWPEIASRITALVGRAERAAVSG
ncbi:alpha/beta fold hydrolase [Streptomyces katrae]|uniref:Alpha/beta hydrolase n=1 Tax=Streptomyces katrae TaxID=68223 RepID=A0A0F4JQS1_9ACTN|nr:alpha/beta hydrolase [Streptomyces katrae]KJY36525.1 alpha/beta hydrolase [Streptomyces katrae]